jgi:hypothetical protein
LNLRTKYIRGTWAQILRCRFVDLVPRTVGPTIRAAKPTQQARAAPAANKTRTPTATYHDFLGIMVTTRSKCPQSVASRTRQSIKTPVRNATGGRDPGRLGSVGGRSRKGEGRGISLTKKNETTATRNEEAETVQVEAAVETVQVEAAVLPLQEDNADAVRTKRHPCRLTASTYEGFTPGQVRLLHCTHCNWIKPLPTHLWAEPGLIFEGIYVDYLASLASRKLKKDSSYKRMRVHIEEHDAIGARPDFWGVRRHTPDH